MLKKINESKKLDLRDNKFLVIATPLFLFLYLIINGFLGVKFGHHWDEWRFAATAAESLKTGIFLPHEYIYPSLCHFIYLISAMVYKAVTGIDAESLVTNTTFYQYVRCVFIVLSSLTVIWVYIISIKVTKNYFASLVAGLIICSSFEFSYHLRWAVSDCLATQFVILSALFLFININLRNKIIFSSLTAGIAAGTKYTAGIILLCIILFILSQWLFEKKSLKAVSGYLLLMLGFFTLGFVITTPGSIFEYQKFLEDVILQKNIYSSGHIGHTIPSGFEHFSKISEYLFFEISSRTPFISILILLLAVTGVAAVIVRKQWTLAALVITMIVYIVFVSTFRVMIVRNVLYVLPVIAILCSVGFEYIASSITNKNFKHAFGLIILLLLFYSCSNVVRSSLLSFNKSGIDLSAGLKKYVEENPDKEFVFSPKVSAIMNVNPVNKDTAINPGSYLVFFLKEMPIDAYTANIRNQFEKVIGMDDVNLDYYPIWRGEDRILIMENRNASDTLRHSALGY